MFLKKLSLINYKNLPELEAEFCSGINCFIGQNGVGKTNLLDTVYYLAFCKSHTNNIDSLRRIYVVYDFMGRNDIF